MLNRPLVAGLTCLVCALETACPRRDCGEWHVFEIPAEIQEGEVGEVFGAHKTLLYGREGSIVVSQSAENWPPGSWVAVDSQTSEDLNDLSSRGSNSVIVGNNGTIRVSRNGGLDWRAPDVPDISADLSAVQVDCSTEVLAVAVGHAGTIVRTDDLQEWSIVPALVDRDLRDVAVIEPQVVAVGDGGTVLFSKDYGKLWVPQDIGTDEDVVLVEFSPVCDVPTNDLGVLMTAGGTFYISEDRGFTWERQPEQAPGIPSSMRVSRTSASGLIGMEMAIGNQFWAMNSPANSGDGWEMVEDFGTPIKDILEHRIVLTGGAAHFLREGDFCSIPPD